MLFFSRSNKLFQWVAPIKSLYRYILTITICIIVSGIWWFCVYVPLYRVGLSYMEENRTMRQQCDFGKQECHMIPSLESTVKELRYDLDIYSTQVASDLKDARINDIMHVITANGLSLSAYTIEREVDKKSYTKSIMRFSLVGSYQQLLNFLAQMHTKKFLISCKNISLYASEPEKYTIACEFAFFSWVSKNPST